MQTSLVNYEMKVIVIGGTGHIGTYLIPRLVMSGHEVVCVSRQQRAPYTRNAIWKSVKHVIIDRDTSDAKGEFGLQIKALKGDIVMDLICFTPESAVLLAEALTGEIQHFIHCGTLWVHGYSEQVPVWETQERKPFGDYGINKANIESYLLSLHRQKGFPVTVLHPGHITGSGWLPINPAGNLNPDVFIQLSKGKEISLPNFGMETLHHVHADDVALAFVNAMDNRQRAVGESFHVVSEQALTLRGFANAMAKWFGQEAKLTFLPWEEWKKGVSEKDAALTWDHIAHSPNGSIAKAKALLNFYPRYSSLEAVQDAIKYYFEREQIVLNNPR